MLGFGDSTVKSQLALTLLVLGVVVLPHHGKIYGKEPSTAEKKKIPTAAELTKSEQDVNTVFDFSAARSEAAKLKLAAEVIKTAVDSDKNPAAQYVMFRRVRDIAISLGNRALADRVVQEMDARFDVDTIALRAENLQLSLKASIPVAEKKLLLRSSVDLIDEALAADRFSFATELARDFTAIARRVREADLVKVLSDRRKSAAIKAREYQGVEAALETLRTNPEDESANLIAGKHFCFSKNDWSKGLPMLARCGDASLMKVAHQDMKSPSIWQDQCALADEWWRMGNKQQGAEAAALKARGGYWYRHALATGAKGLKRIRAQKHYGEVAKLVDAMLPTKEAVPLTQPNQRTDGLILHYTFDHIGDEKLTDASGRGNHGKIFGTPNVDANGKVGSAFRFKIGDYVSLPSLGTHKTFTIAMWLRYVPQTASDLDYTSIYHNDGGWGKPGILHIHHSRWGRTNLAISGSKVIKSTGQLTNVRANARWKANSWQHYVFAFDMENHKAAIYVDGKPDHVATYERVAAPDLGPGNIAAWNGKSRFFVGAIDDFRIYNRALTAEQASALHNLGAESD